MEKISNAGEGPETMRKHVMWKFLTHLVVIVVLLKEKLADCGILFDFRQSLTFVRFGYKILHKTLSTLIKLMSTQVLPCETIYFLIIHHTLPYPRTMNLRIPIDCNIIWFYFIYSYFS